MIGLFVVVKDRDKAISTEQIKDVVLKDNKELCFSLVESENTVIARNVINKFKDEQILCISDGVCLAVDGVILNSIELIRKHHVSSIKELFFRHIRNNTLRSLLAELRGSFCGIVVNGSKSFVFTDQLATKQLFYANVDNSLVVSSEVNAIVQYFKANGIKYSLDEAGVYSLMSYAYMYLNHTLVKEIKRVRGGMILQYEANCLCQNPYYHIPTKEINISRADAVEKIDELFLRAIRLQVEKNKEYGYCNPIPLSAGMDCRMTAFAAQKLAADDMLNFSYSEYGQEDCITPGLMARELGNRWLFKSLDNGLDMFNIQESIDISDGLIYYLWPAQLNDFLKLVDTNKWGIVHTGVIGDVVLGCWQNKKNEPYVLGNGAVSLKLIPKLADFLSDTEKNPQSSYELGMFQNRAINGACMGYSTTFRRYCIDMSPFMNIDFFNFCLSLPFAYRKDHSIYYEWVRKKYPLAAKYKHNGITIKGKRSVKYHGQNIRLLAMKDLAVRSIKRFQRDTFKINYGMNPQEAWLNTNSDLREKMTNYFDDNKNCLDNWPEIYKDACQLFANGSAIEKCLAISAVGSVKRLFD